MRRVGTVGAMARSEVKSEISGRVWKLEARVGDRVAADDAVLILESMKMEIPVPAPASGRVLEIRVAETDLVEEGQVVAVLET
jgi:acetyl-CoA carboxylase biotin carboxyl carrier protein